MNELINVKGVRGRINGNGDPELHLEDVSRGLGFTQVKNNVEYVRWETIINYLQDFGFSQLVGKEDLPEYIAENIFYKLCFKAKNEVAVAFQDLVTDEILPTIRKTGIHSINNCNVSVITAVTGYIREVRRAMEKQGSTPRDVSEMIELVCRRFQLPLPLNFVKELPFEQLTLTINIGKS